MATSARTKAVTIITAILAITALSATPPALEFEGGYHPAITTEGLASFLRTAVRRSINEQHAWMDDKFPFARAAHDEKHFDDCEFDGAAKFIREQYRVARTVLTVPALRWTTSTMFGRILHTVQDFYSHSNWVELGFPLTTDNPATAAVEVAQSDLVDLSGAQSSLARRWFAPSGGAAVRGDILLGGDDWTGLPAGSSIERNGGGRFIPTLRDAQGRTLGRLLVTGRGKAENECDVTTPKGPNYSGIKHEDLNKDCPNCGAGDVNVDERKRKHAKARALATLQTGYEWCRLVREAGLVDQDGLLLALWVRAGGTPHPPGTPCSQAGAGPTRVVVTIESIRILDAGDGEGKAGEIQLAAALYDNPLDFRRSVHVTNRDGRMGLRAGDLVPSNQLPGPLRLCVPAGRGATFTLHAWDNDDPLGDHYAFEFDNEGNHDDVLVGFQRRFGGQLPAGIQRVRSADLEVRFRVSRTAGAPHADIFCPQEALDTR